jgi:citrate synthase
MSFISILMSLLIMNTHWLTSTAALTILGVQRQTLYANVSRKRIRVKPDPGDPRRRLYHAADVRRLAARHSGRPSSERVAAEAVSWGFPVLESAICTVAQGRLWYRGQDVLELASHATLEEVAALLWQCGHLGSAAGSEPALPRGMNPLQAAYHVLAARAGRDPPMYGRAQAPLQAEAASLFSMLAQAVLDAIDNGAARAAQQPASRRSAKATDAHEPLHVRLAQAWHRPEAADLIRRALVLLADHELNASTFATRVAASTGACLAASLLAGFATLSGPLHGTAASGLAPLAEAATRDGAEKAIRECLERGQGLAAFGHPLYPDGDVRARSLLGAITLTPVFEDLLEAGVRLIGEQPNVDFALAALAASTGLPADAPFALFALARSTGWIAHALEQHGRGSLIRPRARYTGPALMPRTDAGRGSSLSSRE